MLTDIQRLADDVRHLTAQIPVDRTPTPAQMPAGKTFMKGVSEADLMRGFREGNDPEVSMKGILARLARLENDVKKLKESKCKR